MQNFCDKYVTFPVIFAQSSKKHSWFIMIYRQIAIDIDKFTDIGIISVYIGIYRDFGQKCSKPKQQVFTAQSYLFGSMISKKVWVLKTALWLMVAYIFIAVFRIVWFVNFIQNDRARRNSIIKERLVHVSQTIAIEAQENMMYTRHV